MFVSFSGSFTLQCCVILSIALVVAPGCGKPKTAPSQTTPKSNAPLESHAPSGDTASIQFRSIDEARTSLAGVWLGKAVINQQTLQSLLTSRIDPSQRQALRRDAQTFASTQMAMQLDINGAKETAVEVTPAGGNPIQGQTIARWNVIQAQGNQVIIESMQADEYGRPVTSRTTYTVSPDRNRIVMQANVGSDLSQCEPLIYLDRQTEPQRVAEMPDMDSHRVMR